MKTKGVANAALLWAAVVVCTGGLWHDVPQIAIDVHEAIAERCTAIGVTNYVPNPTTTIWHVNIPERFDRTLTNLLATGKYRDHYLTNTTSASYIYPAWTYTGLLSHAIGSNEFIRPGTNGIIWHYLVDVSQRWHVVTNLLITEQTNVWPIPWESNYFVGYYYDNSPAEPVRWVTNILAKSSDYSKLKPEAYLWQDASAWDCGFTKTVYGPELFFCSLWQYLIWTMPTNVPNETKYYTYGNLADTPSPNETEPTIFCVQDSVGNLIDTGGLNSYTQMHACAYYEDFGHEIPDGPTLGYGWYGWMTNATVAYWDGSQYLFPVAVTSTAIGCFEGWTNLQAQGWQNGVDTNECYETSAAGYTYWLLTATGLVLRKDVQDFTTVTNLLTTNAWKITVTDGAAFSCTTNDPLGVTGPTALQVWSAHRQGYESLSPGRTVIKWGFKHVPPLP